MIVAKDKKYLINLIYQKIQNHSKSYDEVLNLTDINVSQITDMSSLFSGDTIDAEYSNDPIEKELIYFFNKAYTVNISNWNTINVVDMTLMFDSTNIKIEISHFDTSNVEDMSCMFMESNFNGNISGWDVSKVKEMQSMFSYSRFNGDISNWDVSSVTNLSYMFSESCFNRCIKDWDVSNVKLFTKMFDSSSFRQDIYNWKISKNARTTDMFGELKPLRFYIKALRTKNNQYKLCSMTSKIKLSKRLICASRRAKKVKLSKSKYRGIEHRNTDKYSIKILLRNMALLSK